MREVSRALCDVLFMVSVVAGCATTRVAPNAVDLQVEFAWASEDRCSDVSPEIRVSGVPSATKHLRVIMTDLDKPDFFHGGGTVDYQGSNVIPKGALKSYTGPCPPSGQHSYSIRVDAVDEDGVIIGSGEKTLRCCP